MDYAVIHLLDEAMKLPNFKIYSVNGMYGIHIEADGVHYDGTWCSIEEALINGLLYVLVESKAKNRENIS